MAWMSSCATCDGALLELQGPGGALVLIALVVLGCAAAFALCVHNEGDE